MAAKTANVTVNANEIKTRDYAMVALINGATKSGAHKNHRKEANRNACRKFRSGRGEW